LAAGILAVPLGCGTDGDQGGASELVGTAQFALTARAGENYRLANVTVTLTGPSSATLAGNEPVLRHELPVGDYLAKLENGWSLEVVDADGSEHPISAALVSKNPLAFSILSQEVTRIAFELDVNGTVIQMDDGSVSVAVNVDDNKIDDFEDGDGQILKIAGRSGGWFSFNDQTSGVQIPSPSTPVLPVPSGPNGDLVLHTAGSGFTLFGSGIGATLATGPTGGLPYNAAGYQGIRFMYTSNDYNQVMVRAGTSATTPIPGGTCDPALGLCFDDFQTTVQLYPTTTPTKVEVRWETLSQVGFGIPVVFDPTTLIALVW